MSVSSKKILREQGGADSREQEKRQRGVKARA
jgi:hypothetical protein